MKITVIMSVYNTPTEYLERCINSIYASCEMTGFYEETEALICDDGSTEQDTIDMLHDLISKYSNMTLFTNDTNRGVSYSLNKLISHAQGKYIAQMDSDDFMRPERLRIQYRHLEQHPEITGVFSNTFNFVDKFSDIEKVQYWFENEVVISTVQEYIEFGGALHPSFFYKREDVVNNNIKYDERYIVAHDYDYIMNILYHHCKLQCMRDKLIAYLRHSNSLTIKKKDIRKEEDREITKKYEDLLKKEEL